MGRKYPESMSDEEIRREMNRLSRRGFVFGGSFGLTAVAGWTVLHGQLEEVNRRPWPIRDVLEANERLWRRFHDVDRMSPTFPRSRVGNLRVNGRHGIREDIDLARWNMTVESPKNGPKEMKLSLDDVRELPRVEMITEHKCIEGWSTIVHWTGVRFVDFVMKFGLGTRSGKAPDPTRPGDLVHVVHASTPDEGYDVSIDMASALHPQTLLCYALNGETLSPAHGAPLRLVVPHKYGVKSLKRIGTIRFTDERIDDYWTRRGYDWYLGL